MAYYIDDDGSIVEFRVASPSDAIRLSDGRIIDKPDGSRMYAVDPREVEEKYLTENAKKALTRNKSMTVAFNMNYGLDIPRGGEEEE